MCYCLSETRKDSQAEISAFEKHICLPVSEPNWSHIALFNKTSAICLPERIVPRVLHYKPWISSCWLSCCALLKNSQWSASIACHAAVAAGRHSRSGDTSECVIISALVLLVALVFAARTGWSRCLPQEQVRILYLWHYKGSHWVPKQFRVGSQYLHRHVAINCLTDRTLRQRACQRRSFTPSHFTPSFHILHYYITY